MSVRRSNPKLLSHVCKALCLWLLLITAQQHRTQERNRAEALDMLIRLVQRAAVAPVRRVATKPSAGARRRRVDDKVHRGKIKATRSGPAEGE